MSRAVESSPKQFVSPTLQRATLVVAASIMIAGSVIRTQEQGWTLVSTGLGVLAALFVLGFVESLLSRVVLYPETLVVVSNFRRREYARDLFKRVTWEKGAPVALEYENGGWLKLPGFVGGGPGVLSTFRAWLGVQERAE